MMKIFFLFLFAAASIQAANIPTIHQVIHYVAEGKRAMVQGEIKKQLELDVFVMADKTGELVVNLKDVQHSTKVGDTLVMGGLLEGSELQVFILGDPGDTKKVAKIAKKVKFTKLMKQIQESEAEEKGNNKNDSHPTETKTIEERLNKLNQLKAGKLITQDEYKEHRKRILNEL